MSTHLRESIARCNPQPQTVKQTEKNGGTQKQMGMSDRCQTLQTKSMKNSSSSGGFSGNMRILGGLAGSASLSGNFQSSSAALDTALRKEGCGSMFIDTKTIMDAVRRVNCAITQNASESSVAVSASATVLESPTVRGCPQKLLETQSDSRSSSGCRVSTSGGTHKCTARNHWGGNPQFGEIEMTNTKITAKAGTKIKASHRTLSPLRTRSRQLQQIAKTVARTYQQSDRMRSGSRSRSSWIRRSIDRRTKSTPTYSTALGKQRQVNNDGNIEIIAPTKIDLSGVTLDANSEVDIVTSVTTSWVELGKKIASELMWAAASKSSVIRESRARNWLPY